MTEAIKKLIAENRWQPIESAPDDMGMLLIKFPRIMNLIVRGWRRSGDKWFSDRETDGGITRQEWPHEGDLFRALPDDRLAEVCGVLLEALRCYELEAAHYGTMETSVAHEALSRANEIALSVTDERQNTLTNKTDEK